MFESDYKLVLSVLNKTNTLLESLESRLGGENATETTRQIFSNFLPHLQKNHPHPIIVETNLEGDIIDANEDFLKISKYSKEEIIGQNMRMMKSGRVPTGVFQQMWTALKRCESWRGELENRCKDYDTYWIDCFICPILNENGQPIKYLSISFDISDQVKQRLESEAKSKDIMESIRYAKRIQKTILPDKAAMDEVFDDYFVLFKPKDIVSGDFYWFNKTINKAFLAVVDCTGHGVPGAFMSLIGYNLLNQIVNQMGITEPGKILSELHNQVRQTLKQDSLDSKSRDGMDICLCAFDRYGEEVQFAGAFRPLLWYRTNLKVLEEIKGDKFSIGGEQLEEERVFTNNVIEVESGDIIYMFSDGIVDQFGGPELKKFSTKRFKSLIEENHHESMNVQRALFNIVWKDWRGDEEQTDDVTMIGIRF